MSDDQQSKKIEWMFETLRRLEGDLLGTQAAIRGLILSHPDVRLAYANVVRELEKLTAPDYQQTLTKHSLMEFAAREEQFCRRSVILTNSIKDSFPIATVDHASPLDA